VERRRITVSGNVQGVGFRYYVKRLADRLNVYGTVENLENGSVEIICQAEDLDEFLEGLNDGPGEISNFSMEREPVEQCSEFRILA